METVTIRVRSLVWFASGVVVTLLLTLVVFQSWRVDAAPGDVDSTFVPMSPCRLMDTRPLPDRVGSQGVLGVAATSTVQGTGSNGECVIPVEAVGLSINVTALNATVESFLTFWPGGAPPLAASLNPAPGQPPVPNAVTVSLSGTGSFNVYNNVGTVDIVVDVNGYYVKTSLTELAAKVAALDAREPFAVTAVAEDQLVTSTVETVVSVTLTAPAAGQVTVNSSTTAQATTAGDAVYCSIDTALTPPSIDLNYLQNWQSGGGIAGSAQMAGTRMFNVAAGVTETFELVCRHSRIGGGGFGFTRDSVLTAIYTPAP